MTCLSRGHTVFCWAWPKNSIDHLLQAAAHADDDAARAAWRQWAHGRDLDDVRFNEMRLLAAVAPRLNRLDPAHGARSRIVGIERMLWSRSQVVLRDIQPALELLRQEHIDMMVLKGAARAAREASALKLRFVNDVDILVAPHDFRRAFDLLDAAGWRSTATGTSHFQRAQLDRVHGVNLIQGNFADLDIHRSAFHEPHMSLEEDSWMWDRSQAGSLAECPVRVPSATDTVILALAHGGPSGHRTSDWLLDMVAAVNSGGVDWKLWQEIIERRHLEASAAVSLTYLADKLGCPIPGDTLEWTVGRARRAPVALATGLLLSRPKDSLSPPLKLARLVTKAWRTRREQRKSRGAESAGVTRRARPRWGAAVGDPAPAVHQTTIRPPDRQPDGRWQGIVDVTLALPTLKRARRIEFELHTEQRHVARVTYRKLTAHARRLTLHFRAPVTLEPEERELLLEAAPGRGLRPNAPRNLADRYAPVPFSVVDIRCRRQSA
jgi:Uncharacterised nucleotidyltransferase